MHLQFAKLTGAGNDFVLIDNRDGRIGSKSRLARRLCDRRFGIGADGMLVLERSTRAHYKMRYFNADGSSGGMCGNGGRCIARYAILKGIAPPEHTFEALNYVYRALQTPRGITLHMKNVPLMRLDCALRRGGKTIRYHQIDTGAPHIVVHVPQPAIRQHIEEVDVAHIGRDLRYHRAFLPAGTNVNFLEHVEGRRFRMRTYERGVEAETLACGTGSIASAIAASVTMEIPPPIEVITQSRKRLHVDFELSGRTATDIRLTGPAILVFEGTINV